MLGTPNISFKLTFVIKFSHTQTCMKIIRRKFTIHMFTNVTHVSVSCKLVFMECTYAVRTNVAFVAFVLELGVHIGYDKVLMPDRMK